MRFLFIQWFWFVPFSHIFSFSSSSFFGSRVRTPNLGACAFHRNAYSSIYGRFNDDFFFLRTRISTISRWSTIDFFVWIYFRIRSLVWNMCHIFRQKENIPIVVVKHEVSPILPHTHTHPLKMSFQMNFSLSNVLFRIPFSMGMICFEKTHKHLAITPQGY